MFSGYTGISLSVRLSACPSVCPPVCLTMYPSVYKILVSVTALVVYCNDLFLFCSEINPCQDDKRLSSGIVFTNHS